MFSLFNRKIDAKSLKCLYKPLFEALGSSSRAQSPLQSEGSILAIAHHDSLVGRPGGHVPVAPVPFWIRVFETTDWETHPTWR